MGRKGTAGGDVPPVRLLRLLFGCRRPGMSGHQVSMRGVYMESTGRFCMRNEAVSHVSAELQRASMN